MNNYVGHSVPDVMFRLRVRDESIEGPNPYRWDMITSEQYFSGKRVIVFSLPGAFTPTCSTYQLPSFENKYEQFKELGIDEIYCMSVNDSFVMNAWARSQNLKNVKVIPDGNGSFTGAMDMLVDKYNLGFGARSWRYAMIVNDGIIEVMFDEPNKRNNADDDPYDVSSPENILEYLNITAVNKERGSI